MYVELDIIDLLNLVNSKTPCFEQQQSEYMLDLGRYSEAFDRWIWNDKINSMTEQNLYALYQELKNK